MERAQTISGYLAARGLGSPERRVRLRRRLELEPGVATAASLCLTEGGAWIVAATSPERGLHVNVLERSDLRFRRGRLFDELVLGSDRFLVAPGHGDEAAEIVGIARLRARGRRCVLPEQLPRHVDARSELERCYLEVALAPDEVVLAWLPSCTSWRLESPIDAGGSIDAPLRLLVTERRVVLVALSALGDVRELGIEPAPIRVTHGRKRITLHVHEHEWRADSHHTLYEEISEITARSAPERLREAARTNYLSRESGAARLEVARSLLTAASDKDDPIAPFVRRMVAFDTGEALATLPDIEGTLDAFRATNPHRLTLADVWERWQLSPLAAMALVSRLRELPGSDPWVLELHARARDARVSQSDSGATSALIDIALAEHFLAAGERSRARRLLEARLNALPDERLEDLLPPRDADLTAGAGGQVLRIRIHELIASLEPGVAVTATGSVAELARLQPLVHTRVERLAHEASDDLALRASAVLDLLEPGGIRLENLAADPLEQRGRVLSGELIGGPLKHPLARDGDALLGKLQALLALVPSPDPGVLMDYCERLSKSPDSHAAAALARAARILDITKVEAYVSRGSKGVGVRAYEHGPPFVLIGGRHLDPDDEYAMTPLELCFALGAELAHLRFGHTRVTSSEVWAGALHKTKDGLDLVLSVLPIFKGVKLADRLGKVATFLPLDALKRGFSEAGLLFDRVRRAATQPEHSPSHDAVLSRLNEELVAAHRLMQLTADRAGLIVSGSIGAAVRSMLLVRPDYREKLRTMEQRGLAEVLAERDERGKMAHQDLAVRVAALVSFYLSDDYARLASAVTAPT